MITTQDVIGSLVECKKYAETVGHMQTTAGTKTLASSSSSTDPTKIFESAKTTLENFVNSTQLQRITQTDVRAIKELGITLFNVAKTLQPARLAGAIKYVAGLALRCISFDRRQCCSVFESAAGSFTVAKDMSHARDAHGQALMQLEGARDSPNKESLVAGCLLGMAKCLVSPSSSSFSSSSSSLTLTSVEGEEDIKSALEYIRSGSNLPSLSSEDRLRLQQFVYATARRLARDSARHVHALAWLSHALQDYQRHVSKGGGSGGGRGSGGGSGGDRVGNGVGNGDGRGSSRAPDYQIYESHTSIASLCLLLQLEIQIKRKDASGAEDTIRMHEQVESQKNKTTIRSGKEVKERDRWNQAYVNLAALQQDHVATKQHLDRAIQFALETSIPQVITHGEPPPPSLAPPLRPSSTVTAPIVGARLRRLLDMATTYSKLLGWSIESLLPFMELAGMSGMQVLEGPQDDTRTYQQQLQQRQEVYLDVVRRVMMELVDVNRTKNINVTVQMMQVFATMRHSPVSGKGRKILTSILAEYGALLYHAQRWADGQTIMRVLLVTMNTDALASASVDVPGSDDGDDGESKKKNKNKENFGATSIESVHHMMAEMFSFQEQHEQAWEETKLAGTSFDAHHLRFRLLLRKMQAEKTNLATEPAAASSVPMVEDLEEKVVSEQEEEDSTYDTLLRTTQQCLASDEATDRGLLSIAYELQKTQSFLPKVRSILCVVLISISKFIATKEFLPDSVVRGQIFANLIVLQVEMINEDERLLHVAAIMQRLVVSLKKYGLAHDVNGDNMITTSSFSFTSSSPSLSPSSST